MRDCGTLRPLHMHSPHLKSSLLFSAARIISSLKSEIGYTQYDH